MIEMDAFRWLEMIELDWILAGSRRAGRGRAMLALDWLEMIELGWLEMIQLDWISAGSRLALGLLEMIELG
jgi:hypothetical protein